MKNNANVYIRNVYIRNVKRLYSEEKTQTKPT